MDLQLLQGHKHIRDLTSILVCKWTSFLCLWQISLLEMPEHKKKKMVNMTANVMRDENDKVKINIFSPSMPAGHLIFLFDDDIIAYLAPGTWSTMQKSQLFRMHKFNCQLLFIKIDNLR